METSKKIKIGKMLRAASLISIISISLVQCKKDKLEKEVITANTTTPVTYSSAADFFDKNGVPLQTYTIDAAVGGTFTSPQGTAVTIPANAFVTSGGAPITGNVSIEFKDIYRKSDMLLSNMPTQTANGPLVSAGEFFIKAIADGNALGLATGKRIDIEQPAMGLPIDTAMAPFIFDKDSLVWKPVMAPNFTVNPGAPGMDVDQVTPTATSYIYNLYQFNNPATSGTWCNSDNAGYFSAYPQTSLTMHPADNTADYNTNVFLVFPGINSMVHVYQDWSTVDFPYLYAPLGLQCTVVTLVVKNDKIYSSFDPITIGTNQTVNFTVTETTTEAFKTALDALN